MAIFSVLIPKELGSPSYPLSEVPSFFQKKSCGSRYLIDIKYPAFGSIENNSCVRRIQKGFSCLFVWVFPHPSHRESFFCGKGTQLSSAICLQAHPVILPKML